MRWIPYLLFAAFVAAGLALYHQLAMRVEESESAIEAMTTMKSSYVTTVGPNGERRVFTRAIAERPMDWAARVKRITSGEESLEGYNCTTITGCDGGYSIEVCTPCPIESTPEECAMAHEDEVAAFCRVFQCDC